MNILTRLYHIRQAKKAKPLPKIWMDAKEYRLYPRDLIWEGITKEDKERIIGRVGIERSGLAARIIAARQGKYPQKILDIKADRWSELYNKAMFDIKKDPKNRFIWEEGPSDRDIEEALFDMAYVRVERHIMKMEEQGIDII